jgi:hypothetical protein
MPRKRPSIAAATVPEYSTSSPRLAPLLIARDQNVRRLLEQPCDRDVHAVRRRAVDVVELSLARSTRSGGLERQRVRGAATVAVRRDDDDVAICFRASRAYASHAPDSRRHLREECALTILKVREREGRRAAPSMPAAACAGRGGAI